MKKNKGLFITLEGGDSVGKSTLSDKLTAALQKEGISLLTTREPGGTTLSEKVRDLLLHSDQISHRSELFLFLAARAEQYEKVISPALTEGKWVLCDRYHDSTIAYQGIARNLGQEEVAAICNFCTSGKLPDLTLYLDLEPTLAFERKTGTHDRIESETISFHHTVREAYLKLAKENPDRIIVVNAEKSPEEVYHQAKEAIDRHVCNIT